MSKHHCHATGCEVECRPTYLMCFIHWSVVPSVIQREVNRYYQTGQCDGEVTPSESWHKAADAAIGAVALLEGQPIRKCQLEELLKVPRARLSKELFMKLAALERNP